MIHSVKNSLSTRFSGSHLFPALFIGIIVSLLYIHFFILKAHVEITIETDTSNVGFFKIYWAGKEAVFKEENMNWVRINNRQRHYRFFIGNLGEIKNLRIDPLEYSGQVKLKKLIISQPGYSPVVLDDEITLSQLKVVQQFYPPVYEDDGLKLSSAGGDPQLGLEVNPIRRSILPLHHWSVLAAIFGFVALFSRLGGNLFKDLNFVPVCLVAILILVITMASLTGHNVHPDESAHLAAVKYYGKYLFPPPIDSPLAEGSFSIYGYSRLVSYEIYYQLAGYFSRLIQPFKLDTLLAARAFGVAILLSLLLFSIKSSAFRYFSLPVLVSAQAWYLFSYVNSDGFALFLAVLVSYQVAYRGSLLNHFLIEENPAWFHTKIAGLGLLLGSTLLLKTNYYFLILFIGLYLLWRITQGDFPNQKRLWIRIGFLAAVGVALYSVRIALDIAANGPNRTEKINEQIERHAKDIFKPSTPLEHKHEYLYLRDRGFTLEQMLQTSRWIEKTFITAFGAYGYTQYLAPEIFYDLVRYTGILILILMLYGALVKGPPQVHWLFFAVLVSVIPLVVASFWWAWSISYQPQGRYMMPFLPVLGILYYEIRDYVPKSVITALVSVLFLLGVYSFLFIGLHDIFKAPLL